ncbi:hypothetical protein F2P56_005151 [Juglans regia]|uniref:Glutamate receptor n=2 Tax=Juglans regia TaxID=51240 RepID=A0A834D6M3_JUGRE|nr:glutamate receptor 2.8-like [Juglans regia]KAF5478608.1 hypothetical protein F2P56_005151 [Juglans regia]
MDMFSFTFLAFVFLLAQEATADHVGRTATVGTEHHVRGSIGAIVDDSNRAGKEQKVAMEMAIKDFYDRTNQSFDLHMKICRGEQPYQEALAAWDLINKQEVQAIISPGTWEGASLVAEIGNQAKIPVLSIADSTPLWALKRWPFLLQASPNQNAQMKAIAAIVQSWEWHQITVIYEDIDSFRSGVMPHLSEALQEVGAEISNLLALSPFSSPSLSKELERLKGEQCRVFVVHLSLPLAVQLFERAKEMNMMEIDYVWITTDPLTSLVHSLNASTISSMRGTLGIKSYFPQENPNFQDFYNRFRRKYSLENPEEEDNHEPGTFAVQAYDAVWTVCLAMRESSKGGKQLLDKMMLSEFNGLSGKARFLDRRVAPAHRFQVINVIGKSYNELGFWSDRLGFSVTIDEKSQYNPSMRGLGQVFWPGGPLITPRGWTPPTDAKPLIIGVPTKSSFKKYVNVILGNSTNTTHFDGFAIDLFKATVERLPFYLPYNFTSYNGTYDNIVKQVHLKKFDAVIGDIAIVSKRYQHAEFTIPYTESGLVMIVPARPQSSSDRAWLFMKPFTKAMWVLIGAITVYNGFVIWLIERKHCPEFKGSGLNQMGTLLSLAFTTLFSLHGGKLHSNLSRMAMLVWLFVALVLTQTFTANLTTILTLQRLEPTVSDVESLRKGNAVVGNCRGSFVASYLEEALEIHPRNIKNYDSPAEYVQALRSQEIAAAFLEVPYAKLFLAKYCKEFTTAGPTFKVGGFGYVFPKGSPLLPEVNKALLKVFESGELLDLETSMITSQRCVDMEMIDDISSLSPSSFWVLFLLTAGTSTAALVVYVVAHKLFGHRTIWTLVLAVMRHWWHLRKSFSRRVSITERSGNFSNTYNSRTQV